MYSRWRCAVISAGLRGRGQGQGGEAATGEIRFGIETVNGVIVRDDGFVGILLHTARPGSSFLLHVISPLTVALRKNITGKDIVPLIRLIATTHLEVRVRARELGLELGLALMPWLCAKGFGEAAGSYSSTAPTWCAPLPIPR